MVLWLSLKSHKRWEFVGLGAALLIAFLLRLAYLRQMAALPLFDAQVGDSAAHLKRAAEIAGGAILPPHPFFYSSIFYPYFLAAALAVFHGSLFGVCLTQVFAGVVVVALLAYQARAIYGTAAGLATCILGALYGPFAFLEADILGAVWCHLALSVAILMSIRWAAVAGQGQETHPARLGLAGIALGLAVVERANLLIVVPAVGLWCAMQVGWQRAIRPLASFAGGVMLPLALVLTLNVAGSGQWVFLTTSFGINLSLGYHEGATGTFDEPWEREAPEFAARHTDPEESSIAMASLRTGRPLTGSEASAYWTARALEFIRQKPLEAAALTVRKAALMLNGAEVANHLNYAFIREVAPALKWMPIGFGWILPLAAIGFGDALLRRTRRAEAVLLAAIFTATMLSVVPFTVADRYRAPMVVPLLIGAGGGVAALMRIAREPQERSDRRTLILCAAALCAVLVTMIPLVRPLKGRDYWIYAQAYERQGNMRAAVRAYEAAVQEESGNGSLLNNLGVAYKTVGDKHRAVEAFRRAIEVDSTLALPHKNLGMALISAGDFPSALVELQTAVRLEPGDAEAIGAIGAILAERGDMGGARVAFARARALAPTDARLLELIKYYTDRAIAGMGNARPGE